MSAEFEEVRQRREGLRRAIDAHDLDGVKSFIDPSFVARSSIGLPFAGYEQVLEMVRELFQRSPGYREELEMESIAVEGDVAHIRTRLSRPTAGFGPREQWITTHQIETWRRIDGQWMLVEERSAHPKRGKRPSEIAPSSAPAGRGDEASPAEPNL